MKYGIWCAVWGGVTGHRESWMKKDGKPQEFENRDEAEALARNMTAERNGNPYRTASFSYTVKELQ